MKSKEVKRKHEGKNEGGDGKRRIQDEREKKVIRVEGG